jgi:hypothetical protein
MATGFYTAPGYNTGKTLRTRNIFTSRMRELENYVPSLSYIDGAHSRDTGETPTGHLRAGLLVGKITATGLYRPSIIGIIGTLISSGTKTSVTVPAVVATEVARLITLAGGNVNLKLTGPPSAAGTNATTAITATAASGTTITVSSVSIPDMVATSILTPADGSETVTNVIGKSDGIDVVDEVGNSINQGFLLLRGADLVATQLINMTESDASVQSALKTALKNVGVFTFDNDR